MVVHKCFLSKVVLKNDVEQKNQTYMFTPTLRVDEKRCIILLQRIGISSYEIQTKCFTQVLLGASVPKNTDTQNWAYPGYGQGYAKILTSVSRLSKYFFFEIFKKLFAFFFRFFLHFLRNSSWCTMVNKPEKLVLKQVQQKKLTGALIAFLIKCCYLSLSIYQFVSFPWSA